MEEIDAIASGILQAVKRGESLEKAVQTFINAGYPKSSVGQATKKAQEALNQKKFILTTSAVKEQGEQDQKQDKEQIRKEKPRLQKPKQRQIEKPVTEGPEEPPEETIGQQRQKIQKKEKSTKKILAWITGIVIIAVTLLINGFLIWKYLLSNSS